MVSTTAIGEFLFHLAKWSSVWLLQLNLRYARGRGINTKARNNNYTTASQKQPKHYVTNVNLEILPPDEEYEGKLTQGNTEVFYGTKGAQFFALLHQYSCL